MATLFPPFPPSPDLRAIYDRIILIQKVIDTHLAAGSDGGMDITTLTSRVTTLENTQGMEGDDSERQVLIIRKQLSEISNQLAMEG